MVVKNKNNLYKEMVDRKKKRLKELVLFHMQHMVKWQEGIISIGKNNTHTHITYVLAL